MFRFEVANNILANLVVIWLQYQKTYYLTKPIMVSTCMKLVLTFSAFNILINAQKKHVWLVLDHFVIFMVGNNK